MRATMRTYNAPADFFRVRDFLQTAFFAFGRPVNWGLERWNWGRYHPSMWKGDREANRRHFEDSVRIWEDGAGRILAVLNTEQPKPNGEAWIQRLPEADLLLDGILSEAERSLADPADGMLRLEAYDHDEALVAALAARGYARPEKSGRFSEIAIAGAERPLLGPGFRLRSMADSGSRLDLRCEALGRGFNHVDPAEWSTPEEYALTQAAPDYHPELDLVVETPDGGYASGCIVWHDARNHFGVFEPVCTVPEHRRKGLGRAVIREGLNRLLALGARGAYVGSGQDFYAAIGFDRRHVCRQWTKATRG